MSLHIEAQAGAIADVVLLPGDPQRARFIAETYFDDPVLYNERRAAFGYTGTYEGRRVSVQATGMGVPSASIYVHELIADYGARHLIRIGTCGAIQPGIGLNDIILGTAASTDSAINRHVFGGRDFAPAADFGLLHAAYTEAKARDFPVKVGTLLTCDRFYDEPDFYQIWARHGVLAVEMEAAGLYTLAARHGVCALTIVTVSDVIETGEHMDPKDRERSLDRMITLALSSVAQLEA